MENFGFDLGVDAQARIEVRRPMRKRAQLRIESQTPVTVETIDISHGGVCVMADNPMQVGQTCSVEVEVFYKNRQMKINLEGEIIYCLLKGMQGYRTGIRIMQIDPDGAQYVNSLLQ